jgi:hypothetical protein
MLQQQMTSSLYDKMQDSQEGVISVITEVRMRHMGESLSCQAVAAYKKAGLGFC